MFRYLVSILTIGLISTLVNASGFEVNKSKFEYQFNINHYPLNLKCNPAYDQMHTRCVTSPAGIYKKTPECQYKNWVFRLNKNEFGQDDDYNYISNITNSVCYAHNKQLIHNPTLSSNFARPDENVKCGQYTNPKFEDLKELLVRYNNTGGYEFQQSKNSSLEKIYNLQTLNFLNAYQDQFKDCFYNNAVINISDQAPSLGVCGIQKVACSKFFKTSGGNLAELHRGLIEQLMSTSTANDITDCLIYLAVDKKGNKYAYNDASLSWNLIKETSGYYQILDDTKATGQTGQEQVKKLSDKFVEERFPKADGKKNLEKICSDEQVLALLERKIITINDIEDDAFKKLLKHESGQLLVGKYANDILKEAENNNPDGNGGNPTGGSGSASGVVTGPCVEPSPDGFTIVEGNNTISLKTKCEDVCKNLPSINPEEQKRCNKRCLKERKGYSYSYEQYNSTTSKDVTFQEEGIVFSNFKDSSSKSYEQALLDYDACLISIGKKMSQEKKWETGLTTSGMVANLLMGLYGMYSTSSMNDDNFMLQVEMLRRQDQCYSLNPEQSVISNTKKRSFFGWIFSGMKSTFKEEQPYKKLSEVDETTYNNLKKKTYSIKNPVTGVTEDMTAYDICVLNKALSSMNQTMQNQMLCNQLMSMGIINQREYKACMLGKDLKYGTGGNTPFAKGAEKEKPIPAPEKKEKKEEEPKKDDKPAGTTPAGGGTPGSTPSASNKETPDYMRNYPYYKSSNRGGGNLGYSDGKQPYYGGGDAGTAGQNSVDLKAGTGTGADAGTAGNFLIDNLPGINSTTYNSISSGRKQ